VNRTPPPSSIFFPNHPWCSGTQFPLPWCPIYLFSTFQTCISLLGRRSDGFSRTFSRHGKFFPWYFRAPPLTPPFLGCISFWSQPTRRLEPFSPFRGRLFLFRPSFSLEGILGLWHVRTPTPAEMVEGFPTLSSFQMLDFSFISCGPYHNGAIGTHMRSSQSFPPPP